MRDEIQQAVNYLCGLLEKSGACTETFKEELSLQLTKRYEDHWFPEQPERGCAFRCVERSSRGLDACITAAAQKARVDVGLLLQKAPERFTIWVDPGEVSARLGSEPNDEIHIISSRSQRSSPALSSSSPIGSPQRMNSPPMLPRTPQHHQQQQQQQQHLATTPPVKRNSKGKNLLWSPQTLLGAVAQAQQQQQQQQHKMAQPSFYHHQHHQSAMFRHHQTPVQVGGHSNFMHHKGYY